MPLVTVLYEDSKIGKEFPLHKLVMRIVEDEINGQTWRLLKLADNNPRNGIDNILRDVRAAALIAGAGFLFVLADRDVLIQHVNQNERPGEATRSVAAVGPPALQRANLRSRATTTRGSRRILSGRNCPSDGRAPPGAGRDVDRPDSSASGRASSLAPQLPIPSLGVDDGQRERLRIRTEGRRSRAQGRAAFGAPGAPALRRSPRRRRSERRRYPPRAAAICHPCAASPESSARGSTAGRGSTHRRGQRVE